VVSYRKQWGQLWLSGCAKSTWNWALNQHWNRSKRALHQFLRAGTRVLMVETLRTGSKLISGTEPAVRKVSLL